MHNSKNDIESIKGACHSLSFDQLLVWVKDSLKKLNFKDSLEIIKMASEKLENPSQLKLFSDAFHQIPQDKLGQHLKYSAKVAVGGNSNNKILADTIAANMIREGIVPNIYELSFDQWVQELMNPESGFYGFNPSFLVLYLSNMGLKKAGAKKYDPDDLLKVIDRVVEEVKGRLNLQIIMVLPEPMEEELTIVGKFYLERHRFNERLISKYENDLIFIDPSTILAHMGAEKWFAPRYWYTAKFPFHPAGIFPLSRQISAAIARSLYQKIKVIVCDLDDFLWGGIVGEDGLHGLDLDANEVGGNYIRLQKYLLSLREQGMILVIASKNNEEDVRAVFENREEMVLKWEDFACHRINWKPKSQNIGEIAQELNLSIDSFCFLDDSPHEREEVRFSLPEVVVPEIPDHPEEVVPFLVKSLLFYMPRILREDAKRSEYYLQEKKRKGLKEQFSHLEDYL
ncbi:MAG: HAD-IIIC family phosphatase, partial [Nitrospinales bacterium]